MPTSDPTMTAVMAAYHSAGFQSTRDGAEYHGPCPVCRTVK